MNEQSILRSDANRIPVGTEKKTKVLKRYLESEALRVGRLMNLQVRGGLNSLDSGPSVRNSRGMHVLVALLFHLCLVDRATPLAKLL